MKIDDDDIYNRICNLMFCEQVRLENYVEDKLELLRRVKEPDPRMYIALIQAQAVKGHFECWSMSFLRWLDNFF